MQDEYNYSGKISIFRSIFIKKIGYWLYVSVICAVKKLIYVYADHIHIRAVFLTLEMIWQLL